MYMSSIFLAVALFMSLLTTTGYVVSQAMDKLRPLTVQWSKTAERLLSTGDRTVRLTIADVTYVISTHSKYGSSQHAAKQGFNLRFEAMRSSDATKADTSKPPTLLTEAEAIRIARDLIASNTRTGESTSLLPSP